MTTMIFHAMAGKSQAEEVRGSLVAWWVKDPVLSLLWWGFDPWPGNFCMLQPWPKKKKKIKEKKRKKEEEVNQRVKEMD